MNLPNKLTVLRMIMVPFFLICMTLGFHGHYLAALILFCLASITDYFDGKLARSRGLITNFGKFLDPLADKITQFTLIICLALRYPILWAVSVLFFVKELFQLIAGILAANRGYILKGALITGKVCTTILFISLVAMVIFPNIGDISISIIALVDTAFLLISFADYFRTYTEKSSRFQPLDDTPSANM